MVVALLPVRRLVRLVSLPVLHLVLRLQAQHRGLRAHRAVLLLHGHGQHHLLHAHWLHRLLLLPVVRSEDLRCYQGGLR